MANQTWIRAIFQGDDGSLGFQKDHEYEIRLTTNCTGAVDIYHPREGSVIPYQNCKYGSLRAFLMNWRNINYSR